MTDIRKPRSDSIDAQLKIQNDLKNPIKSIIELTPEQTAAFNDVIETLPRDSWDRNAIRMAGKLAKLEVYLDGLIDKIISEGPVIVNDRGTPISNPAQTAMTTTASTVKMLRTSLGLSASQRATSKARQRPAIAAERNARSKLQAVGGKNLLA